MTRNILAFTVLLSTVGAASAQPMAHQVETIDWMAADSQVVARATVADFTPHADADQKWNTITFRVNETLKGPHQESHTCLAPSWSHHDFPRWKHSGQELLILLIDTKKPHLCLMPWQEKAKAHALTLRGSLSIVELRDPVCFGKALGPSRQIFMVDVSEPKEPEKFLDAMRMATAAATQAKELKAHRMEWPLRFFTRIVPVNANLERQARHWIRANDAKLREQGALVLRHFKSDENVAALKGLLRDPATSVDVTWEGARIVERFQNYPVRASAFATLKAQGVGVRKPIMKERIDPQTAGELLAEVKKVHERLAGTWYLSHLEGPEAFQLPGQWNLRKRFEGIKVVLAGDKVTIHDGKQPIDSSLEIPLAIDPKGKRIVMGAPQLSFLGRRAIVRREGEVLEISMAIVPEGSKPDFDFVNPVGSRPMFTERPRDFDGLHSLVAIFRSDNKPRLPEVTFGGPPAPWFYWGTLAWSPDGQQLAMAFGHAVEVRDPSNGKPRHFLGHEQGLDQIAFSPDGRWLACAESGGDLKLWDVAQRKIVRGLPGGLREAHSIVFSEDAGLVACQSYSEGKSRLMIWETATGKTVLRREPVGSIRGLAFSPDRK